MFNYVVLGNPIAHSKSPIIHRMFAEQTGEAVQYEACLVPEEGFVDYVRDLQQQGVQGCNVTMPFKQQAWALADELNPLAERAHAVNTLMLRDDGQIYGANTDGVGLTTDLKRRQVSLTDARILVLGAGGAVRGVLGSLLAEQPASIFIANRTAVKAEQLAQDFSVQGGGYEAVMGEFDVIINGTAASLQGDSPPIPESCLQEATICYDMMYASAPTPFMRWARQAGLAETQTLDGLGMLVEQAAESFYIWRGVRPDTSPVMQYLRQPV